MRREDHTRQAVAGVLYLDAAAAALLAVAAILTAAYVLWVVVVPCSVALLLAGRWVRTGDKPWDRS